MSFTISTHIRQISQKSTPLYYTSVKQGKFGAAMKTTYGVNSAVRSTLSAYIQHHTMVTNQ